jgi:hypothetical protein
MLLRRLVRFGQIGLPFTRFRHEALLTVPRVVP